MAKLDINRFQTYTFLTPQEEKSAYILTEGNIQNISNQLVAAISEKLALEIDMSNPSRFLQQEASLAGQIKAYQFLLDLHEDTINAINDESVSQS